MSETQNFNNPISIKNAMSQYNEEKYKEIVKYNPELSFDSQIKTLILNGLGLTGKINLLNNEIINLEEKYYNIINLVIEYWKCYSDKKCPVKITKENNIIFDNTSNILLISFITIAWDITTTKILDK